MERKWYIFYLLTDQEETKMHRTIEFPNIGIHLKNVGDHITVFGFDIAYYGMIIDLEYW